MEYTVSSGTGGGTPTLQQVLDAGSTLSSTETINLGTNTLILDGTSGNKLTVQATTGTAVNAYSSSGYGATLGSDVAGKAAWIYGGASGAGIQPVMTVYRVLGTPAVGYGGGINLDLASSTLAERTAIGIHQKWVDHTDATRTAELDIQGVDNALTETFMNIQKNLVRINDNADTLATKADVRSGVSGSSLFLNKAFTNVDNSGTSETDLDTYTIAANTLTTNGDIVNFSYTLNLSDITATATVKTYFAGTATANTGALTVSATGAVIVSGWLIRTNTTTARVSVNISSPTASTAVYTSETDLTGLDFTATNIIKITGQAGGAGGGSGDITFKMGTVKFER